MTMVQINADLRWNVVRGKGGAWVGICEPLKLTVQAQTWAELMEDIGHTLDAILKDLLVSNELSQFLQDHGWKLVGAIPARPEGVRFDVPFFPEMMGTDGPPRAVYQ
jgi:predicted RNase H-like HicB family nuclease